MPFDIATTAANAANGAIGQIMGLALEKHNDKRQIKQQQKLTNMQIDANRNLAQFSSDLQYDMWKKTNYSAQKEQMEQAGLNPALLYGMSGGGATTTGSASAGSATGAQAPSGGGESMGMGLQMMNLQLMKAQKENIEADTANKQADTVNKPLQGKNIEAQTELTGVQTQIAQLEKELKDKTLFSQVQIVSNTNAKLVNEAQELAIKVDMDSKAFKDRLQTIHAEMLGAFLNNANTAAQTTNTKQATEESKSRVQVNQQQIKNWVQANEMGWRYLSAKEKEVEMQKLLTDFKIYDEPTQKMFTQAVDGIFRGVTSK